MVSIISVLFSAIINLTVLFFKVGMLLYRLKIKSFFAPKKGKKKKKNTHALQSPVFHFAYSVEYGTIESEIICLSLFVSVIFS